MNLLITGIGGFVGSNLLDYYSSVEDVTITGMVRNEKQKDELTHPKIHRLLTLKEVVSGFEFDAVIHLAGKAHDIKQVADEREYFISNEKLTIDLFNAFLSQNRNPSKFIFVSSISVFSTGTNGPIDENAIPDPDTPYGESKFNAENYILSQSLPDGKNYVILRPTIIYGKRSKGNLNLLYNMIESGIPYPLGAYDNKKSFLSVDNICYVIDMTIQKEIASGIYHVADDDTLSTTQVVKLIYECLNKRPRILHIPKFVISLLAQIGDHIRILINSERVSKLTGDFVVSNKKLKKHLDIELPVKTEEGLKSVFNFYSQFDR